MRRAAQAVLLAVLVSTAACGAEDAVIPLPTDESVVGAYNLTIVNGGSLPFPYSATVTSRIDIFAGRITLTADHSFSDALTLRETFLAGGAVSDRTETLTGSWLLDGNVLTLTYAGHGAQQAQVAGKQITRNDGGLLLTYSK